MVTVFAQGLFVIVFATSFAGKIHDVGRFRRTIMAFDVLPWGFSASAARLLVTCEGILVVLLLAGLLVPPSRFTAEAATVAGLTLAEILLIAYTVALSRVKVRQVRVSCNCFGVGVTVVSWLDVVRNGLFLLIGGLGLAAGHAAPSLADRAFIVLVAAPVALLLINFSDVVSVSQKSFTAG
jgi:hypothetical protein